MTTARTDARGEDGRRRPEHPGPHDFLSIEAHLSEEELKTRAEVRRFVREHNARTKFGGPVVRRIAWYAGGTPTDAEDVA